MRAGTPAQHEVADRLEALGAARRTVELVGSVPLAGRGAVDSADVGDRELLRVCVSSLAHLARRLPPAPPPPADRRRWWRRPVAPAPFEAPFDELVGVWWQQRVRTGSGVRWRRVWDTMHARDAAPWTVLTSLPLPGEPLDPVGTDLLRRLQQALATSPAAVRTAAGRLVPPRAGEPLGVPPVHLPWAVRAAERQGVVVPSTDPSRPRRVPVAAALARAIEELTTSG